ncbi:MAG: ArnT family glycosyltransferase, partial [Promethearchaeota archaeon]
MSQSEKSITVDEFSHFPSGIYNLITFDWRMDRESPPLIKCIPAIASIITKPKIDTTLFEREPNTWSLGYYFMYNNWDKYKELFQYGRCVIILLGCSLGWLLYKFGTEIYGKKGGLFALFLFVFNPNILAHSRLITIDIGASCAIFFSIYCFWKYLKRRDLFSLLISGGSLGLAQLSKFTALLLYPIFIIIMCILAGKRIFYFGNRDNNDKPHLVKEFGHFLVIFFISLLMINAGYLFSGTFTPLGDYSFLSGPLRKISSLVWETLPLPLPHDYITGLDSQLAISEGNNPFYIGYLMGEHSLKGWWYYYIIAFMVKNPLVFLLILPMTMAIWMKKSIAKIEDSLCIWIPVIMYLLYFSF